MNDIIKTRINMFVLCTLFVVIASIGSFRSNDFSLLNDENSIYIGNEYFEPNLSMHRINKNNQGRQEYSIQISKEELSHLKTDHIMFFLNRLTDNAYNVRFNGMIIASEGDMDNGQSILRNGPNYFMLDKKLIKDTNELLISTYATYKSGLESAGIYMTDSKIGIRQAQRLDFFGIQVVFIGMGILISSTILMVLLYFINKKQEIAFLYCAIATFCLTIYCIEHFKFGYLPNDYIVYKKIFLSALYLGSWFYILAMGKYFQCFYLKYSTGFTAISFMVMSFFVKDFILYKRLYQYWYVLLLINILLAFIYSFLNIKKSKEALVFFIMFLYLFGYTGVTIFIEFSNTYFNINSTLVYIVIFAVLPLLFGFEELTTKEKQLTYEKELRKNEYMNSITDSLTGTWNQRFLYRQLKEITGKYIIAMLDIDDFKEINDNYGHLAGDFVLKEFSDLAIKTIRKTDDLYRYGGDEFIIIFNECNKKEALLIMERLRKEVEKRDFIFDNKPISITVSIGIYKPLKKEAIEEILMNVDQQLYRSKEKGKNVVSLF